MTKAALEGLGLAFGVTESLIVEVESEVIDSMGSQGPEGSATSRTPWGIVASRALPHSVASATGPAVVALSGTASRTPEGVLASLVCLHRVEGASRTRGRVFPAGAGAGLGWGTIDKRLDMSYEFF